MKTFRGLVALSVLAGLAVSANALTFKAVNVASGNSGQTVNVTFAEIGNWNIFAGRLQWQRFIGPTFSTLFDTTFAYCVDIQTLVTPPDYYVLESTGTATPPLPSGITSVELSRAGRFLQQWNSWAETGASFTAADRRAALQVAIWGIVYGGVTSLSGGGNVVAAFNQLQTLSSNFTILSSQNAEYWNPNTPLNQNATQAQISYVPGGGSAGDPVPEPFTMGLVGAAALAALKRRRAKKV